MAGIEAQQSHAGTGGNGVGSGKAQMLGKADQQQEKAAQGRAHQQVLHRVNAQLFHHFKQAHGQEGQDHKQGAVFGGAVTE